MVGRMVRKHIDIESNIGGNDLEVKPRTISGSVGRDLELMFW